MWSMVDFLRECRKGTVTSNDDRSHMTPELITALWANRVTHDCLLECGGDVSAALSAAEYILSTTKPDEETETSELFAQPDIGSSGAGAADTATTKINKRDKKPQVKSKNKDKKPKKTLKRLIGKKKWISLKPRTIS
jgi:hypothetical protein